MKEMSENICLCGSGKPYQMCCKSKINPYQSKEINKRFIDEFDKKRNRYKKVCMHPHKDKCSEKIHAHTISKKAVLEIIADNSIVLMPKMFGIKNEFKMHPQGIESQATKFYCFCSEHDKMFYPIDKHNVTLNQKNCFLYAYRIFASTYYKIMREIDCHNSLKQKYDLTKNPYVILFMQNSIRNLSILDCYKEKFDKAITNNDYSCIESVNIVLDYKVFFSAATCFCPLYDVLGNEIIYTRDDLPLLYISVIPDETHTKIIFSWFKEDNYVYGFFREQIKTVPTRFVLKFLNNLLPLNCENMVVSPKLWKTWTKTARKEYLDVSYNHLNNIHEKTISKTYFEKREYNLFYRL